MDIDEELDSLFKNNEPSNIPIEFPYYYINLCKVGMPIIYKPLVDSNGKPFRLIQNLRQGSIDYEGESLRFRIMDKSGFKNITESQKILVDNINRELDIYCNKHPDEWQYNPIKSVVISYCILTNLGETTYNKLKTSVMVVNSSRYIGQLKKFILDITTINGKDFINKLFSRSIEYENLVKSFASRADGYGYSFNFDTIDQEGEIEQELIDKATNLDIEYVDIINFNEELYSKVLKAVIELNKK